MQRPRGRNELDTLEGQKGFEWLKLEHRGLKDEVRAKPRLGYVGFMLGHGQEFGICSKCSEGHLDIKQENNEIDSAF